MTGNVRGLIKLPHRLGAIVDFIDDGADVADIGTDHGLLPVYLALSGLARRIIASDISVGSLEAARRSAAKYAVTDKITFINAPGLNGVTWYDIDIIVIAGLGGETIVSILSEAPWTKCQGVKLLLQPQSKIDVLSRFLYDNDYTVNRIKSITDRGRQYTIMEIK
jgi:tRNA (adenine22-N1)-methyltransferase